MKPSILLVILIPMLVLASLLLWPEVDLIVSSWFHTSGKGFLLANNSWFLWLHWLAYYGARVVGVILALLAGIAYVLRKDIFCVDSKGWFFLFLALMIGPVLIANVVLKDHWGRARPREITEFGGAASFSPAWIPQLRVHRNDSFVAGDAAFGFYLPCFAFVVPLPKKSERKSLTRRFFWGGMAAGSLLGFSRIAMGAHFFSDVLFAAFFMLACCSVLHAALFGRTLTAIYWRNWFFAHGKKEVTLG
jgi:lipid A 4'-phosphatase